MSDIIFFDAFTNVGPRVKKHPAHAWKLSEVMAEMDHCSISGALVTSTTAVTYEPMFSNLELSERIAPYDHLFAAWNLLPHNTQEFPAPPELERLMRRHDVRAVTLHPIANNWTLLAEHNRPLLAHLAKKRVLTILPRSEFKDYAELQTLLRTHPKLPLLVTGAHWLEQRFLLPLMPLHKNLHISFDKLQGHYVVEHLVSIGCEDQLLFASNAPHMSMGAHRCYIDYADIPVATRRKIAGGNLSRLLKGQAPPRARINRGEDDIMAAARGGRPLPVPVLDMHLHILHEGMNGAGGTCRMQHGGPKGVLSLLKRLGVVGGGFMSWNGVVSADTLAGNETVRQTLDATPKGYWGLASFDPAHYTQAELATLIPQVYADKRYIGMKPYYVHGVPYHHKSYDIWWRFGAKHRLYALIHRTRDDFLEVDTLAKKYPEVRWVVAHCGESHKVADLAAETMLKHSNVYAEITLTPVTFGVIDYLVAHGGADRVVYGSDLPMRDPRQQLGWVVYSRLPVAAKRKLLSENARRVIAPCLKRLPVYNRPA
jgi:predicted TIM-barrel fold metal-dependent hydrolase